MKYKLIQTYPGSPKLGTETEGDEMPKWYLYDSDAKVSELISVEELKDFPEFWELID